MFYYYYCFTPAKASILGVLLTIFMQNISNMPIQEGFSRLSMCLAGFVIHETLPDNMISVILVPVIKGKMGGINSKDDYRPIALASVSFLS